MAEINYSSIAKMVLDTVTYELQELYTELSGTVEDGNDFVSHPRVDNVVNAGGQFLSRANAGGCRNETNVQLQALDRIINKYELGWEGLA